MKYYLLQFKFLTPVHFGTAGNKKGDGLQAFNCCADTLFSALVTEAAALSDSLCGEYIEAARDGRLLLSDLMPYYSGSGEELYVPVPLHRKEKVNPLDLRLSFKELCLQYEERRGYENMEYIRVSGIYDYLHPMQITDAGQAQPDLGWSGVQRRMDCRSGGSAYYVSNYTFAPGAGLYCIIGVENEELLNLLVKTAELLGLSGIGGRRSSGFGKFILKGAPLALDPYCTGDAGMLYNLLNARTGCPQMALSVLCPQESCISIVKQGAFKLLKRSGFIYNRSAQSFEKRSSVYMLQAGSCFPERVEGRLLEFAAGGAGHSVYRYGKAIYMGLPV